MAYYFLKNFYERTYPDNITGFHSEPYSFEHINVDFWYDATEILFVNLLPVQIFGYITICYLLKKFMKNRPPYNLSTAFGIWSAVLGFVAFATFVRIFPEFLFLLKRDGLRAMLCTRYFLCTIV